MKQLKRVQRSGEQYLQMLAHMLVHPELYTGHGRTLAQVILQNLRLPAQDQAGQHSSLRQGGLSSPRLQLWCHLSL